ncbi:myotubularin-related protein DDB_G0290005 [Drosophila novamexicana]|uniref:myotubularin-related protein DDB_G0290005 n=1 Tax=Drosophila novamexicana TaxID=47314 RepID=UPI0011E5EA74|nr:myotubularin-related protein DDB_G0290005 [Drosophila novamexicana]
MHCCCLQQRLWPTQQVSSAESGERLISVVISIPIHQSAVGRSEDDEASPQRYRLFKRSAVAEGRTLSQLLSLKGGNCSPGTTTTTITPTPSTTTGTSTTTTTPSVTSSTPPSTPPSSARGYNDDDDEPADEQDVDVDDDDYELDRLHADDDELTAYELNSLTRRGSNRPVLASNQLSDSTRLQAYELRRQTEQNKLLRQRIQFLRRQSAQNRRRAQRARKQQRRRNKNNRRRLSRRNRRNRRRANTRNRLARRRQRRNRRRN